MHRLMTLLLAFSSFFVNGQNTFFYKEADLSFTEGVSSLYGVLTIPQTKDSLNVVTIIVAGSGPTDKDGNQYGVMFPNTYKFLAHSLAQKGISTFRFDKRGAGASAFTGVQESKLTFDTYIDDLCGWINYLRKYRQFKKIILIGHSEGALISFVAGKKTNVDGYIALASPGTTIDKILETQIKERLPGMSEKAAFILDQLRNKQLVDTIPQQLASIFRKSVQPYFISMMAYDPTEEISSINSPVLIIQGDNDLQVKVAEAEKLVKAKSTAKLVIIPGMNHVLKICGTQVAENIQSYHSPSKPISGNVSEEIFRFLDLKHLL